MREITGQFKKGHEKIGGFTHGSKHTEQARKLVSQSLYGKRGKLARRWKGDAAGYTAIHMWVVKSLGKANHCANLDCRKLPSSRFEWASISGECRRDLLDFLPLCTRCHRSFDNGNLQVRTKAQTYVREKFIDCPNCSFHIVL